MTSSPSRVVTRTQGRCVVLAAWLAMFASGPNAYAQARAVEWRLSAPLFAAGRVDGAPGEAFTSIGGAARLRDGRYLVADARELRFSVFAANGRLQHTFGRNGDGPGEFRSLRSFWITGGDTIAVWDSRAARITRLLPDGTVTRTDRLVFASPDGERRARVPDAWFGALRDGRIVLARIEIGQRGADGLQPDRMMFDLYHGNGQFERQLGEQPGMLRLQTEGGSGPHPFSPFPWAVVVRDTLIYTSGVNGELHFYSATASGARPDRTLRVPAPALSRADAWRALDRAMPVSTAHAVVQAYTRETDRGIGVVPLFGALLADDNGRIWLKEYDPATDAIAVGAPHHGGRWRIIQADGRAVASISMPARVRPLAVQGDLLLAVARDDLDVQTFVVYRILN